MEIKDIGELIKILDESTIAKLEFFQGDNMVTLEKEKNETPTMLTQTTTPMATMDSTLISEAQPLVDAPAQKVSEEKNKKPTTLVHAPLVGVFYQAASPDSASFVKVGQVVNKGDTVCIIEAMKVLNEIKASVSGVVEQIHVNDGDVVEFDQILMEISD